MTGGNFRENLRNELNYQGITVKELSGMTGIPVATLDCYLGTRAASPSVESAVKIALALQVSVEYLVFGENPTSKKTQVKLSREEQELIRLVKRLTPEQRGSILNLVNAFKYNTQTKNAEIKPGDIGKYGDLSHVPTHGIAAEEQP